MNINTIINKDVLDGLKDISDEVVALTITSSPYNLKINYDSIEDDQPYEDYLKWLKEVFSEVYRVTKYGGRCAINIDAMTNRQDDKDQEYVRCIYAHIYNIMKEIGWKFRTEICWYKQNAVGKQTAWGCYDDKTRVLTKSGLKYFKDVDINIDEFATLNIESGKLEYHKANNYVCYYLDGHMYSLKSKSFNLMVTEDHNMVYWNKYKKSIESKKMCDMPINFCIPQGHDGFDGGIQQNEFSLPKVEYGKRSKKVYIDDSDLSIDMDDWLRFLGIFLTDGSVYYSEKLRGYTTSIYQSKQKYLKEIKSLLDRLPFKFKHKKSKDEFYTCSKRLAGYLKNFSNKNERTIPDFILDLSCRQKMIFVKWLMIGDGYINDKGDWKYLAVASHRFLDRLCNILLQLNIKYSVSVFRAKPHYLNGVLIRSTKNLNIVNFKKAKHSYLNTKRGNIKKIPYSGYAYCVDVPNHTLFVERDGKFAWCGNSWVSCSNPTIRRTHEYIICFSKGDWRLEGDSELSDMTKDEFCEYTLSTWFISPETRKIAGHPASFPEELVKRLVKLFSYRGDLILDPFNGSGTTTYVAKKFARNYIGIDISKDYCQFARERITTIVDLFENEYIPRSKRLEKTKRVEEEQEDIFIGI